MSNEHKEAQLDALVEECLVDVERKAIQSYPGTFRTAMHTETFQALDAGYAEKRDAFKEILKAHIRWALWMRDE